MRHLTKGLIAAALLGSCMLGQAAPAPAPAQTQEIYTCINDKGTVLTADRPIASCMDRTQTVLGPGGTVVRTIGPSLTAQERAAQEAKERQARDDQLRQAEEKRRDRALLVRYPNNAVHEQERAQALGQVDDVIRAAQKRASELQAERHSINTELEFYKGDPAKIPPALKNELADNQHSIAVQAQFITEQEAEKKRINARFDAELVKLKKLWLLKAPVTTH